jgi:hypothetical protein
MRYFTRDLLDRYGSLDDSVADAAHEEWEQASARYRAHLDTIRTSLPPSFRDLLDRYALHNAHVRRAEAKGENGSAKADSNLYLVELSPESSPDERLALTYVLEGSSPPAAVGDCYWLYDEVDLAGADAPGVFLHRIMFSDGTEIELPFTQFQFHPAFSAPRTSGR